MNRHVHKEARFEEVIEAELLVAGWEQGSASDYRADLGLDTAQLFTFVGATQTEEFQRLEDAYGGVVPAQQEVAKRIAAEIDKRGALDVLRNGVKDRGVRLQLAYFRPGHTLAAAALDEYRANRLTVVRQLHYSARTPDRSLDLTLFVNGIPVATAELKNQLTGRTVEDAKRQYRTDRDPREPIFARRALVHFGLPATSGG